MNSKSKTASKNSNKTQKPQANETSNRPASSKPKEPILLTKPAPKTPIETNLKEIIGIIFDSPEIPNECYNITDETTRVGAFLRHRDTNYLDCLDKRSMEPERLRIAVISSIRYGKVLIFGKIFLFIKIFMTIFY